MMGTHVEVMDLVAQMKAAEEAFVLATVVRTVSVTAAKAGAKAIIRPDGTIVAGWIGGGCARGAVSPAGLSTNGYRTVTIPPAGSGKERPYIARAMHAVTLRGSPLDSATAAAPTAPLGRITKRTATRPWTLMEVCGGQTHTIVKYGIDEILPPGLELVHGPGCPVCVTSLELIDRAHAHGLTVVGGTIIPYQGAFYFTPAGEAVRQAVNAWIRTGGVFDGVIDFDAAIRDPANPARMRPDLQSGDWLHPNDAGYRAMGDAVDLKLFD